MSLNSCFGIHFIATQLLQLTVVSSAAVNYSASAACHECSGPSHHELVIVQTRETSAEAATLAVGQTKNYIQAVSVHALHPHRTSVTILVIDCVSTVSAASGRYRLRSTGSLVYVLPRTRTRFGECGFFYFSPAMWDTLPSDLHDITDTSTFRKQLMSVLFDCA